MVTESSGFEARAADIFVSFTWDSTLWETSIRPLGIFLPGLFEFMGMGEGVAVMYFGVLHWCASVEDDFRQTRAPSRTWRSVAGHVGTTGS